MATSLGELILELKLDPTAYNRQLNEAKVSAEKTAVTIEAQFAKAFGKKISPKVDTEEVNKLSGSFKEAIAAYKAIGNSASPFQDLDDGTDFADRVIANFDRIDSRWNTLNSSLTQSIFSQNSSVSKEDPTKSIEEFSESVRKVPKLKLGETEVVELNNQLDSSSNKIDEFRLKASDPIIVSIDQTQLISTEQLIDRISAKSEIFAQIANAETKIKIDITEASQGIKSVDDLEDSIKDVEGNRSAGLSLNVDFSQLIELRKELELLGLDIEKTQVTLNKGIVFKAEPVEPNVDQSDPKNSSEELQKNVSTSNKGVKTDPLTPPQYPYGSPYIQPKNSQHEWKPENNAGRVSSSASYSFQENQVPEKKSVVQNAVGLAVGGFVAKKLESIALNAINNSFDDYEEKQAATKRENISFRPEDILKELQVAASNLPTLDIEAKNALKHSIDNELKFLPKALRDPITSRTDILVDQFVDKLATLIKKIEAKFDIKIMETEAEQKTRQKKESRNPGVILSSIQGSLLGIGRGATHAMGSSLAKYVGNMVSEDVSAIRDSYAPVFESVRSRMPLNIKRDSIRDAAQANANYLYNFLESDQFDEGAKKYSSQSRQLRRAVFGKKDFSRVVDEFPNVTPLIKKAIANPENPEVKAESDRLKGVVSKALNLNNIGEALIGSAKSTRDILSTPEKIAEERYQQEIKNSAHSPRARLKAQPSQGEFIESPSNRIVFTVGENEDFHGALESRSKKEGLNYSMVPFEPTKNEKISQTTEQLLGYHPAAVRLALEIQDYQSKNPEKVTDILAEGEMVRMAEQVKDILAEMGTVVQVVGVNSKNDRGSLNHNVSSKGSFQDDKYAQIGALDAISGNIDRTPKVAPTYTRRVDIPESLSISPNLPLAAAQYRIRQFNADDISEFGNALGTRGLSGSTKSQASSKIVNQNKKTIASDLQEYNYLQYAKEKSFDFSESFGSSYDELQTLGDGEEKTAAVKKLLNEAQYQLDLLDTLSEQIINPNFSAKISELRDIAIDSHAMAMDLMGLSFETPTVDIPEISKEIPDSIDVAIDNMGKGLSAFKQVIKRPQDVFRVRRQMRMSKSFEMAQKRAEQIEAPKLKDDVESINLAIAGYGGNRGFDSRGLALGLHQTLGPKNQLVPIDNVSTDVDTDYVADKDFGGEISRKALYHLQQMLPKIFKEMFLENNPNKDAIEAAATALAYKRENPKIPINSIGQSGGGFVAKEVGEILLSGGVKSKSLGLSTPDFSAAFLPSEDVGYSSIMGDEDPLHKLTPILPATQRHIIQGGENHDIKKYLAAEELGAAIEKSLGIKVHDKKNKLKGRAKAPDPAGQPLERNNAKYTELMDSLNLDELQQLLFYTGNAVDSSDTDAMKKLFLEAKTKLKEKDAPKSGIQQMAVRIFQQNKAQGVQIPKSLTENEIKNIEELSKVESEIYELIENLQKGIISREDFSKDFLAKRYNYRQLILKFKHTEDFVSKRAIAEISSHDANLEKIDSLVKVTAGPTKAREVALDVLNSPIANSLPSPVQDNLSAARENLTFKEDLNNPNSNFDPSFDLVANFEDEKLQEYRQRQKLGKMSSSELDQYAFFGKARSSVDGETKDKKITQLMKIPKLDQDQANRRFREHSLHGELDVPKKMSKDEEKNIKAMNHLEDEILALLSQFHENLVDDDKFLESLSDLKKRLSDELSQFNDRSGAVSDEALSKTAPTIKFLKMIEQNAKNFPTPPIAPLTPPVVSPTPPIAPPTPPVVPPTPPVVPPTPRVLVTPPPVVPPESSEDLIRRSFKNYRKKDLLLAAQDMGVRGVTKNSAPIIAKKLAAKSEDELKHFLTQLDMYKEVESLKRELVKEAKRLSTVDLSVDDLASLQLLQKRYLSAFEETKKAVPLGAIGAAIRRDGALPKVHSLKYLNPNLDIFQKESLGVETPGRNNPQNPLHDFWNDNTPPSRGPAPTRTSEALLQQAQAIAKLPDLWGDSDSQKIAPKRPEPKLSIAEYGPIDQLVVPKASKPSRPRYFDGQEPWDIGETLPHQNTFTLPKPPSPQKLLPAQSIKTALEEAERDVQAWMLGVFMIVSTIGAAMQPSIIALKKRAAGYSFKEISNIADDLKIPERSLVLKEGKIQKLINHDVEKFIESLDKLDEFKAQQTELHLQATAVADAPQKISPPAKSVETLNQAMPTIALPDEKAVESSINLAKRAGKDYRKKDLLLAAKSMDIKGVSKNSARGIADKLAEANAEEFKGILAQLDTLRYIESSKKKLEAQLQKPKPDQNQAEVAKLQQQYEQALAQAHSSVSAAPIRDAIGLKASLPQEEDDIGLARVSTKGLTKIETPNLVKPLKKSLPLLTPVRNSIRAFSVKAANYFEAPTENSTKKNLKAIIKTDKAKEFATEAAIGGLSFAASAVIPGAGPIVKAAVQTGAKFVPELLIPLRSSYKLKIQEIKKQEEYVNLGFLEKSKLMANALKESLKSEKFTESRKNLVTKTKAGFFGKVAGIAVSDYGAVAKDGASIGIKSSMLLMASARSSYNRKIEEVKKLKQQEDYINANILNKAKMLGDIAKKTVLSEEFLADKSKIFNKAIVAVARKSASSVVSAYGPVAESAVDIGSGAVVKTILAFKNFYANKLKELKKQEDFVDKNFKEKAAILLKTSRELSLKKIGDEIISDFLGAGTEGSLGSALSGVKLARVAPTQPINSGNKENPPDLEPLSPNFKEHFLRIIQNYLPTFEKLFESLFVIAGNLFSSIKDKIKNRPKGEVKGFVQSSKVEVQSSKVETLKPVELSELSLARFRIRTPTSKGASAQDGRAANSIPLKSAAPPVLEQLSDNFAEKAAFIQQQAIDWLKKTQEDIEQVNPQSREQVESKISELKSGLETLSNGLAEAIGMESLDVENVKKSLDQLESGIKYSLEADLGLNKDFSNIGDLVKDKLSEITKDVQNSVESNIEESLHRAAKIPEEIKENTSTKAEKIRRYGFVDSTSDRQKGNYEAYARAVAKESGIEMADTQMPGLRINDKKMKSLGAEALYNPKKNEITITNELAEILKKSSSALTLSEKEMAILFHELRHSMQLKFGELGISGIASGTQSYGVDMKSTQNPDILSHGKMSAEVFEDQAKRKGIKPSEAELDVVLNLEVDAYEFEEKSKEILESVAKDFNAIHEANAKEFLQNGTGKFADKAEEIMPGVVERSGQVSSAFNLIKGSLVGLGLGSVAFDLISKGLDYLTQGSLEAAIELSRVEKVLKFVTGSSYSAAKALSYVRSSSNDLGVDAKESLNTYIGIKASAKDTSLEKESDRIFEAVTEASSAYALNAEAQQRVGIAFSQMISKGTISSEEIKGQLAEALPGSMAMAARSMGMSVNQFNKELSLGNVSSEEFLPKFSDQIKAETSLSSGDVDDPTKTIARFNNKIVELKEEGGQDVFLAFRIGLAQLIKVLEAVGPLITGISASMAMLAPYFALKLSGQMIGSIFEVFSKINNLEWAKNLIKGVDLSRLATNGLKGAFDLVLGGLKAIGPELMQFAIFAVVFQTLADVIFTFSENFKDAGAEANGFAEASDKATKKLQGFKTEKEKTPIKGGVLGAANVGYGSGEDKEGDMLGNISRINGQQKSFFSGILPGKILDFVVGEGASTTTEQTIQQMFFRGRTMHKKQYEEFVLGNDKAIESQNNFRENSKAYLAGGAKSGQIDQVVSIDDQLEQIQIKRRQLKPGSAEEKRKLDTQSTNLQNERSSAVKEISFVQAESAKRLEERKALSKSLKDKIKDPAYTAEQSEALKQQLKRVDDEIEIDIQQMEKFSKILGHSADEAKRLKENFENIKIDLDFAKQKTELEQLGEQGRATKNKIGKNEGQRDLIDRVQQRTQTNEKIENSQGAIDQYRDKIRSKSAQKTLSALGFGEQEAEDIDLGKLKKVRLEEGKTKNELDTLIAAIEEMNGLRTEVASSKNELANLDLQAADKLEENTQAIQEYYKGIIRNAEDTRHEVKKSMNEISSKNEATKIKGVMRSNQQNFVTEYMNSFLELMASFDKITEAKLDYSRQLNEVFRKQQDANAASLEQAKKLGADGTDDQSGTGLPTVGKNSGDSSIDQGLISGSGVGKTGKFRIYDSNNSQEIDNYSNITRHHINRGYENRDYAKVGGKEEEVRYQDGKTFVKKDFVLSQNGNTQSPNLPSPVAGYAKATGDDYNTVVLYRDKEMKEKLGQILHMTDVMVKTGQKVSYGQILGKQGGVGVNDDGVKSLSAYGSHAHMELRTDLLPQFKKYIQSLKSGDFGTTGSEQSHNLNDGHDHGPGSSGYIRRHGGNATIASTGRGGGGATPDQFVGAVLSILESGSRQGRVDVAQVIANRVGTNFDGFGKSIREQAFASNQFQPFFKNSYGIGKNDIQDGSSAIAALKKAGFSSSDAKKQLNNFFADVQNQSMTSDSQSKVGGRAYFKGVSERGNMDSTSFLRSRALTENFYHNEDIDKKNRVAANISSVFSGFMGLKPSNMMMPTGRSPQQQQPIQQAPQSFQQYAGKVVVERSGAKDGQGLEDLNLVVFDKRGKATWKGTVQSGKPSQQGKFGPGGSTIAGSKAPAEYGTYTIGQAIPSGLPGVGKTFMPIEPKFGTQRSALGIHYDQDRAAPGGAGSAGCLVFKTEAEFVAYQKALRASGAGELVFQEGKNLTKQLEGANNARRPRTAANTIASTQQSQIPATPQRTVVIPYDHTRSRVPDKTGGDTFSAAGATGASYGGQTERDYQDIAIPDFARKLEAAGYKVIQLKPEDFRSYEEYDQRIKKESQKANTAVIPYHLDAKGGSALTRVRSGDAQDAKLGNALLATLRQTVKSAKVTGQDTQGNATVKAAAAAPAALIEIGAMSDFIDKYGTAQKFIRSAEGQNINKGLVSGVNHFFGGAPQRGRSLSPISSPQQGQLPSPISSPQQGQSPSPISSPRFSGESASPELLEIINKAKDINDGNTAQELEKVQAQLESTVASIKQEQLSIKTKMAQDLRKGLMNMFKDIDSQNDEIASKLNSLGEDTVEKGTKGELLQEMSAYRNKRRDALEKVFDLQWTLVNAKRAAALLPDYEAQLKDPNSTDDQKAKAQAAIEALLPMQAAIPVIQGKLNEQIAIVSKEANLHTKTLEDIARKTQKATKNRTFDREKNTTDLALQSAESEKRQIEAENALPNQDPKKISERKIRMAALDFHIETVKPRESQKAAMKALEEAQLADPENLKTDGAEYKKRTKYIQETFNRDTATAKIKRDTAYKQIEADDLKINLDIDTSNVKVKLDSIQAQIEVNQEKTKALSLNPNSNPSERMDLQQNTEDLTFESKSLEIISSQAQRINDILDKGRQNKDTQENIAKQIEALKKLDGVKLENLKQQHENVRLEIQRSRKELESYNKEQKLTGDKEYAQLKATELRSQGKGAEALKIEYVVNLDEIKIRVESELEKINLDDKLTPEMKSRRRKQVTEGGAMQETELTYQSNKKERDRDFNERETRFNSRGSLETARASLHSAYGLDSNARQINGNLQLEQQAVKHARALKDLSDQAKELGFAPEVVAELTTNLEKLNSLEMSGIKANMSPLVDAFKGMKTAATGFLGSIISGSESVEDAFDKMVGNVLEQLSNLAAQLIMDQLFSMLLPGLGGGLGGGGKGGGIASILGFAEGGIVDPVGASGQGLRDRPDAIGSALRKEGSNSVLATLTPGEMVLTVDETKKYLSMGLHGQVSGNSPLNTMANVTRSENFGQVFGFASGGIVPGGGGPVVTQSGQSIGSTNVNIPISISGENGEKPSVNMPRLHDAVRATVLEEMRRQRRPGANF